MASAIFGVPSAALVSRGRDAGGPGDQHAGLGPPSIPSRRAADPPRRLHRWSDRRQRRFGAAGRGRGQGRACGRRRRASVATFTPRWRWHSESTSARFVSAPWRPVPASPAAPACWRSAAAWRSAAHLDRPSTRCLVSGSAPPCPTPISTRSTSSTTSEAWRRRSSCVRSPRRGSRLRLAARGYALQGFENQLARVLDGADLAAPGANPALDVAPTSSLADEEQWIDAMAQRVCRGRSAGRARRRAGARRPARSDARFQTSVVVRYLVRSGGQPVGGGAAYFIDGVVGLTGTATVPSHRGRGVQHAVVARMLRDAVGRADLAMATIEPGSQSQRAFERFGFRVIYTRAVFVRPFA